MACGTQHKETACPKCGSKDAKELDSRLFVLVTQVRTMKSLASVKRIQRKQRYLERLNLT